MEHLKEQVNKLCARRDVLRSKKMDYQNIIEKAIKQRDIAVKSRWVLTEVADMTQAIFKKKAESLVTMAIQPVFNRPFIFELEAGRRGDRLIYTPVVLEDSRRRDLEDDLGSSIIDIIGFALRVVFWGLTEPKSRNTFFLDEPMKWVGTGEELILTGMMLRRISHKLGIQLIIVTHEPKLAEFADTAYKVEFDGGKSYVTLMKGNFPIERAR